MVSSGLLVGKRLPKTTGVGTRLVGEPIHLSSVLGGLSTLVRCVVRDSEQVFPPPTKVGRCGVVV